MAAPLPPRKQSVSLVSTGARGSRIRRDPPPAVKEVSIRERDERDTRTVVIGIITFTLAMVVIAIAVSSYAGWTPRSYIVRV